ncbi:unnamed protein product, partial [Scytosiphon promiscuus]
MLHSNCLGDTRVCGGSQRRSTTVRGPTVLIIQPRGRRVLTRSGTACPRVCHTRSRWSLRRADTNYDVCSSPLDNFTCICVMGACEEIFDGFVCEPATPAPVTMAPATPAPVTPDGATCAGTDIEGIVGTNDRGSACCPLGCTQCGGQGCGTSGSAEDLKNVDCCINGVLDN